MPGGSRLGKSRVREVTVFDILNARESKWQMRMMQKEAFGCEVASGRNRRASRSYKTVGTMIMHKYRTLPRS